MFVSSSLLFQRSQDQVLVRVNFDVNPTPNLANLHSTTPEAVVTVDYFVIKGYGPVPSHESGGELRCFCLGFVYFCVPCTSESI